MTDLFYSILALSISITPLILILLWLGPMLNKHYTARWRYIMWLLIAIRLLLPVSFTGKSPWAIKVPVAAAGGSLPLSMSNGFTVEKPLAMSPMADVTLVEMVIMVYLLGLCSYLIYQISAYVYFRRNVIRWSRYSSDTVTGNLLTDVTKELNLKQEIPVKICKRVSSPMVVGLVRPVLLLPSESYSSTELRLIYKHELVHLKRHDIWYKLVLMLATAVHWFNPVVYLMVREANQDMEISCDNQVLMNTDINTKKCYSNLILNLAMNDNRAQGSYFSTNFRSSREALKTRIKGIFDTNKKRRGISALTIIAMVVILSGVTVSISSAEPLGHQQPLWTGLGGNLAAENTIIPSAHEAAPATSPVEKESVMAHVEPDKEPGVGSEYSESKQTDNHIHPTEVTTGSASEAEVVIVDLNQLEQNSADEQPVDE